MKNKYSFIWWMNSIKGQGLDIKQTSIISAMKLHVPNIHIYYGRMENQNVFWRVMMKTKQLVFLKIEGWEQDLKFNIK